MLQFCDEHGLSLLGYSGDRIVCAQRDEYIDTVTGMRKQHLSAGEHTIIVLMMLLCCTHCDVNAHKELLAASDRAVVHRCMYSQAMQLCKQQCSGALAPTLAALALCSSLLHVHHDRFCAAIDMLYEYM
jgi:hypothetical protein